MGQQQQQSSVPIKKFATQGRKGFRVIIHQIQGHVANNHLRVMCATIMNQNLVVDQSGNPLAFNTTIHDPNSPVASRGTEANPIPLTLSDPQGQGISNKAANTIAITYHEEYRFFFDFQEMAMRQGKPIYLGIQVVEKSGGEGSINQSLTLGDYEVIGWYYVELSTSAGEVRVGKNSINLYNPPLRRPPLDSQNVRNQI